MPIDRKALLHTAELARLDLSLLPVEEVERLAAQLDSIVEYVEQLAAVDTTGVETMTHPVPLRMPLRDDEAGLPMSVAEVLRNAPASALDGFVVPRVIGDGESDAR